MVEKNKEKTEEEIYREISQRAPARKVETPEQSTSGNGKGTPTISEAMEQSSDLTDLQSAIATMFPKDVNVNSTMIGRIAPEVFLALWQIQSTDEVMRADPTEAIDINEIRTRNYVRLSIGLDGMGRIDIAKLLGAVKEEKEAAKMLGAGGI